MPLWWSADRVTYPSRDDLDGFIHMDREFGMIPAPGETHELCPYYDWILTGTVFPPDFAVHDEMPSTPASSLTDLDQEEEVIVEPEPMPRVHLASMETRMDILNYGEEDKDEEVAPAVLGRPVSAPPILATDELTGDVDMDA